MKLAVLGKWINLARWGNAHLYLVFCGYYFLIRSIIYFP